MDRSLKFLFEEYSFLPHRRWADSEGAVAMCLAMDLTESGALDVDTAAVLLSRVNGDRLGALGCNTLRIGARLWPHRKERPDSTDWSDLVCFGVTGLHARETAGPGPITTAEDLESCAAVVRFLMATAEDRSLRVNSDHLEDATRLSTRTIKNRHLDVLIRERPADHDRMLADVTERGMDSKSGEAVKHMREWLDLEAPAVGGGWL